MNVIITLIRLLTSCITFLFVSCNSLYKAGNLIILDYQVESNLQTTVVMRYVDTLIYNYGYDVPEKWKHLDKLVDLDSISNKRVYFKNLPEEMYLISAPAGLLILSDVYNEKIHENGWVAKRDSMPVTEKNRILNRFKIEILQVVESMAKRDGLPDSLIYK